MKASFNLGETPVEYKTAAMQQFSAFDQRP